MDKTYGQKRLCEDGSSVSKSISLNSFSGNYVLAGFSDKLRLMNLLIDDIKTFREFQFKNSTACSFSCGGHLLAAVSHNKIGIF